MSLYQLLKDFTDEFSDYANFQQLDEQVPDDASHVESQIDSRNADKQIYANI